MEIVKITSLFIAIAFTYSNFGKLVAKHNTESVYIYIMAAGWTVFIYVQWLR